MAPVPRKLPSDGKTGTGTERWVRFNAMPHEHTTNWPRHGCRGEQARAVSLPGEEAKEANLQSLLFTRHGAKQASSTISFNPLHFTDEKLRLRAGVPQPASGASVGVSAPRPASPPGKAGMSTKCNRYRRYRRSSVQGCHRGKLKSCKPEDA